MRIIFIFTFFTICLSTVSYASDLKIRIGFNSNSSFPYITGSGDKLASPPGVSVEIVGHVMREMGYDVEFIRVPGLRVLKMLQENALDAAFLFSHSKEREEFGVYPAGIKDGDFEARLATLSYSIFKSENSSLSWDGKSFSNLERPIGANTGYSIVKILRSAGVEVEEAMSTQRNIKKLLNRRIDGLADQDVVVEAHIKLLKVSGIVKLEPPIVTKNYYLIFSHKFAEEHKGDVEDIWQMIGENRDAMTEELLPKYSLMLDQ
ncbi:transporter substrate-binding domain-containing protein [Rhodospirillaceae bacterium RKSG073]|nr:transporter substrate-binding domain-containing protein [Curvivirga aplysinae]